MDNSTNVVTNLSPFNFIFDNSKQNYGNCDIAGSFYDIHELKLDNEIQNKKISATESSNSN
jgi:hypothetical protein